MRYSQNNEQDFIMYYFQNEFKGKFVDIGAYDVFRFSNTRALYEKGWSGVLVEPSPKNFKGIVDHYNNEDRISVHNIAIGEESKEIDFYESDGDAVSTSDIDHMNKWGEAGVKYEKIKVAQYNAALFMVRHGKDTDFLNIDTESTNFEVFNAMPPWVWERLKMLCIEHDGHTEEISEKLAPFGFQVIHTNAENIILAK